MKSRRAPWSRVRRPGRSAAGPLVSVVVPVYDVAAYLPACLDSILSSRHQALDVVVVDDGSTDGSGAVADAYADRDPRVRVVHTANHGLGAARNEGLRHVRGDLLAFADSDDVVPATAYPTLVRSLARSGADFATGSVLLLEQGPAGPTLREPPWLARLHTPGRTAIKAREHPEILGDVFAWNKLYRRSWWESLDLSWPEGLRYEDQPTTTLAYLGGTFDVLVEPVYHWRIRQDGSSITQQRGSLADLRDRWTTKQMTLRAVEASPDAALVRPVLLDRVLAGDLPRYFVAIPDCDDAWWRLLHEGVLDLWGERSLVHSGLPPVQRLIGWLVEQDRREDAAAVATYVAGLGRPPDRVDSPLGRRIDVPVIDPRTVDPAALLLRAGER